MCGAVWRPGLVAMRQPSMTDNLGQRIQVWQQALLLLGSVSYTLPPCITTTLRHNA